MDPAWPLGPEPDEMRFLWSQFIWAASLDHPDNVPFTSALWHSSSSCLTCSWICRCPLSVGFFSFSNSSNFFLLLFCSLPFTKRQFEKEWQLNAALAAVDIYIQAYSGLIKTNLRIFFHGWDWGIYLYSLTLRLSSSLGLFRFVLTRFSLFDELMKEKYFPQPLLDVILSELQIQIYINIFVLINPKLG